MTRFSNMKPLVSGQENIEVWSDGILYDLHNWGTVLGVEYRPPDLLLANFSLDEPPWEVRLEFLSLTNLAVDHIELSTHDPDQLDAILYNEASGIGHFALILGDGLSFHFESRAVAFHRVKQRADTTDS